MITPIDPSEVAAARAAIRQSFDDARRAYAGRDGKAPSGCVSPTRYVGECWERFEHGGGHIELTKVHAYWLQGERRFALTRDAAMRAIGAGQ